MEPRTEAIYNKNIAITALVGILAALLLAFREGVFSPVPIYGSLIFIVIMFVGHFLTNHLFPKQDPALFILCCFICQLGLVMLYRIDPESAAKQLIWFGIGCLLYFISSFVCRTWIEIKVGPFIFFLVTFVLLASPLIFGVERYGSKSWISFGNFLFQPSELAKITFSLFLADTLKEHKIEDSIKFFGQIFVVLGLLAFARDLGGAMLFYFAALIIIFAATSRLDLTVLGLIGAVVAGLLGYQFFGHVRVRTKAWLNPWEDVPGKGYQIVQSLFAIAEGGFFGTGLGLGRPDYIPAVTTDFIFSAFFEEFGFLGASALIVVYFLLIYRGIKISLTIENSFLCLSGLGITVFFGIQIFTIIGGVIKLIPMTGVTLPFMSYGGSSMVMSFISLGILNGIIMRALGGEADG
ncbi:FtsW/RodA/SpoVE family cell cycle protein [Tepidanaerobacter sp. GT38]|nr:FtsW/RodA/SpoVE family cell cycle protein [Tepidanaerobacter sp. GT38]MCG1011685.1 FtsW/RodA/SpoVE family cell cycle protein [Tepidanaerobacter sp. GT38]